MDTNSNGKLEGRWLGITLDASDAEAREAFTRRFGYAPLRVVRDATIIHVGPIADSTAVGASLCGEKAPF